MAIIVFAIYVSVAFGAALVAFCNYIICNALPYPFVKNKIFTNEFAF